MRTGTKKKLIFSLLVAPSLIFLDLIVFKYTCVYGDGGPDFYGFPFIYRTDTSWGNSLSGELYILGFILNTLFWAFIIYLLTVPLKYILVPFRSIFVNILATLVLLFSFFIVLSNIMVIDWRYKTHHDVTMDYYPDDVVCKKELWFFEN